MGFTLIYKNRVLHRLILYVPSRCLGIRHEWPKEKTDDNFLHPLHGDDSQWLNSSDENQSAWPDGGVVWSHWSAGRCPVSYSPALPTANKNENTMKAWQGTVFVKCPKKIFLATKNSRGARFFDCSCAFSATKIWRRGVPGQRLMKLKYKPALVGSRGHKLRSWVFANLFH